MVTAREKIANGVKKASEKLAGKSLGGRDRQLYYRVAEGTGGNTLYGIPGTVTAWAFASIFDPNPVIEEIKSSYQIGDKRGGLFVAPGDLKVKINTPDVAVTDLEGYEFALVENSQYVEYVRVQGTAVTRDKNGIWYSLILRRKHANKTNV